MADPGAMTKAEREAFLADVHVGVLAVDEAGRGPMALPIWYRYVDGVVEIGMNGESLKAHLLRAAGRATLTVQTETAPYQYVSVEGPVTVDAVLRDDLEMATRYLGPEIGAWYAEHNPSDAASVTVTLTPEHWRTHDFGKVLG
jgi:hypothetical protein